MVPCTRLLVSIVTVLSSAAAAGGVLRVDVGGLLANDLPAARNAGTLRATDCTALGLLPGKRRFATSYRSRLASAAVEYMTPRNTVGETGGTHHLASFASERSFQNVSEDAMKDGCPGIR